MTQQTTITCPNCKATHQIRPKPDDPQRTQVQFTTFSRFWWTLGQNHFVCQGCLHRIDLPEKDDQKGAPIV